uniref:Putative secreted protein n=1 Tax=Anopheles darlingi TaxID=43151 RepID=A0A2M4DAJ3_ANODA
MMMKRIFLSSAVLRSVWNISCAFSPSYTSRITRTEGDMSSSMGLNRFVGLAGSDILCRKMTLLTPTVRANSDLR